MSNFKWNRKSILNTLMVVSIAAILVCAVMAVGTLKGWFEKDGDLTCGSKVGSVFIERDGIAYALQDGTAIRDGDLLSTKDGGQISLLAKETPRIVLNGQTKISVSAKEDNRLTITVLSGEVLGDCADWEGEIVLVSGQIKATLQKAVVSLSAQSGSQSLCVFSGGATLSGDALKESRQVEKGEAASFLEGGSGNTTVSVAKMVISSLNNFQITQLEKRSGQDLCFSQADLEKLRTDRADEIKKSQQAAMDLDDTSTDEAASSSSSSSEAQNASSTAESKASSVATPVPPSSSLPLEEEPVVDPDNPDDSVSDTEEEEATLSCTIEIRCDTILDNMADLDAGKDKYVPADGEILSTVKVKFTQGETVFDVLKRACSKTGISLEYSWTPMYNSYYIEGINHLYEFDCGEESGWMYKVNGWFPNYGCSSYTLEDGDVIVWCYTCKGLGADVGGSVY